MQCRTFDLQHSILTLKKNVFLLSFNLSHTSFDVKVKRVIPSNFIFLEFDIPGSDYFVD